MPSSILFVSKECNALIFSLTFFILCLKAHAYLNIIAYVDYEPLSLWVYDCAYYVSIGPAADKAPFVNMQYSFLTIRDEDEIMERCVYLRNASE